MKTDDLVILLEYCPGAPLDTLSEQIAAAAAVAPVRVVLETGDQVTFSGQLQPGQIANELAIRYRRFVHLGQP